jgi:hypothetical protein
MSVSDPGSSDSGISDSGVSRLGVELTGVAEYADPHGQQRNDHQQASKVRQATGQQTEPQFHQDAHGKQYGTDNQNAGPTEFPSLAQTNVRLKKGEQHREKTKFNDVRVRGNLDGFVALKLAIRFERSVDYPCIVCGGSGGHVRKNGRVESFVTIEINASVIGAMQKTGENHGQAAGKQYPSWPTAIQEKLVLHGQRNLRAKIFCQAEEKPKSGEENEQSAEVGNDAGPADGMQGTVGKADVMDEKNSDGKKARSDEKKPGKALFCGFTQCNPRKEDREEESEVTEIDHVDVRVNFGSAIFEE